MELSYILHNVRTMIFFHRTSFLSEALIIYSIVLSALEFFLEFFKNKVTLNEDVFRMLEQGTKEIKK